MSRQIEVKPLGQQALPLPLFVDVGVDVVEMGMFRWKGTKVVSYFPTVVQPRNFPNLHIATFKPDGMRAVEELKPYSYKSEEKCAFVLTRDKLKRENLGELATVLNPMGVGVFFLKDLVEGTDGKDLTLRKAPYSMEMVNRLVYCPEPGDMDWDEVTYSSLEMLMYRLKPASLASLELRTLREEFVYRYLVLQFPPSGIHARERIKDLRGKEGEWVVAVLDRGQDKVFSVNVNGKTFSVPFVDGCAAFLCPAGEAQQISVDGVELYQTGMKYVEFK